MTDRDPHRLAFACSSGMRSMQNKGNYTMLAAAFLEQVPKDAAASTKVGRLPCARRA